MPLQGEMGKLVASLWVIIAAFLTSCVADSATVEVTHLVIETATIVPPATMQMPPTATPVPPTDTPEPTSAEEVEEIWLELSFDGERCTYEGPTDIKTGPVTLLLLNESEDLSSVNLMRHTGDETIQDMIDYIGEEPSKVHAPLWTISIPGVWQYIRAGESQTWEGVLEPGIHTMVCANRRRYGIWFGTGLTVEE